jgi:hypothetical protein
LPDVPTVGDFVPGYPQSDVWAGVVAPRGTPVEIINKLGSEINVALADPRIKSRMAELGAAVVASSPAQFQKFIIEEIEKMGQGRPRGQHQDGVRGRAMPSKYMDALLRQRARAARPKRSPLHLSTNLLRESLAFRYSRQPTRVMHNPG